MTANRKNQSPLSKRVFSFKLGPWLPGCYAATLHWLRHLLDRLGRDCALSLWQEVDQNYDDDFLLQILGSGWKAREQDEEGEIEDKIVGLLGEFFPIVIEGISSATARQLVERMPPIKQIRKTFPSLNVVKETTAYEALHLRFDGIAFLAEALIHAHGKQGELIAYDIVREERTRAGSSRSGSVAEFMADFVMEPEDANLFTVGLDTQIQQASEREIVLYVRDCAWARYFRERHPQVGYLLACSTDEAAYRGFNADLRMQRTSTLMEGGKLCDFRIYAVGELFKSQ
jgi:hypothetical protein